ncbi:hypothetical protein FRC00_008725 [Tulasnella sp. 408]|nr:hypothetical protein FRC00_008725 [Tulasnella sp. 408]
MGNDTLRARILIRLGEVFLAQRLYYDAEESYHLSQAIFLSLEDWGGHVMALRSLGRLYDLQGQLEEAEEHFVAARAASASMADDDGEVAALDGLMMVYIQQCKFAELRIAYEDSSEMPEHVVQNIGKQSYTRRLALRTTIPLLPCHKESFNIRLRTYRSGSRHVHWPSKPIFEDWAGALQLFTSVYHRPRKFLTAPVPDRLTSHHE